MDEPSTNPPVRRYRWPYVVVALLVLQALLVVVWMLAATRHVEEQSVSAPLPNSAH